MGVPALEICICWEGSHPVLIIEGELDYGTVPELIEALKTLFDEGVKHLSIDLSQVTFIDSEGVKVLMRAFRRLQSDGGTLTVPGYSSFVEKIFDILGLKEYLLTSSTS